MLKLPGDKGPFCQSCGMPLAHRYDFGTDSDGTRINDYCHHCYDRGRFTDPDLTAARMVEQSAGFLVRQTCMTSEQARTLAAETIPQLKRWQAVRVSVDRP